MQYYIIEAKNGNGVSTYRFDDKERAMEIVRLLKWSKIPFHANFDVPDEDGDYE